MKKELVITTQELVNLVAEAFGVQADVNVIEDGENIGKDVIELYPTEKNAPAVINQLIETLNISISDLIIENDKDNVVISVDFIDLKTLVEEQYNIALNYSYDLRFEETDTKFTTFVTYEIK